MSMLSPDAYRSGTSAGASGPAASLIDSILDTLEAPLAALSSALRQRDSAALEQHVGTLQAALAAALPRLRHPLRPADLHAARSRLMAANALLSAERECIARESASIERGLGVLLPAAQPVAVYGTHGHSERAASSGCVHA